MRALLASVVKRRFSYGVSVVDTGVMVASDVAPDGSPVAVYLALPASPDFDPVVAALPGNGSVLDLGCGTGRLSNLLAELGYEVVAVDESPAMLAHVTDSVERVRGRIEGLDLGRCFDVVVLAGSLINTAELEQRAAFLGTVRRHLHDEGQAFIQRYDPDWALTVVEHDGTAGQVQVHLEVEERAGPVFTATSTFRLGQQSWVQQFRARVVDDEEMRAAVGAADLELDSWLTSRWGVATASRSARKSS